jgi:hypothetical protein
MTQARDDRAELVDEDVIDGEYPPEAPLGVNERPTPTEEQVGESDAQRVAREEPDRLVGDDEVGRVGQLVAPGDEEGVDDEDQEVALEAELDEGFGDWVTQDLEEVVPAEEAAMHLTVAPPMGDGDGYVDEEGSGSTGP